MAQSNFAVYFNRFWFSDSRIYFSREQLTMSSLRRIARHLHADEAPPPAPTGGLGAALEQLVAAEVDKRMAERHRPVPVPRIAPTDFAQVPPPPRTAPPLDVAIQIERDELRRAAYVSLGKTRFKVERDSLGQMVRLVPAADTTPDTPAPPPFMAKAREYNPGEPR